MAKTVAINHDAQVSKVLCNTGESDIQIDPNTTVLEVIEAGNRLLDKTCLNNVVVIKDAKGQHYVMEFGWMVTPVTPARAKKVAENFNDE